MTAPSHTNMRSPQQKRQTMARLPRRLLPPTRRMLHRNNGRYSNQRTSLQQQQVAVMKMACLMTLLLAIIIPGTGAFQQPLAATARRLYPFPVLQKQTLMVPRHVLQNDNLAFPSRRTVLYASNNDPTSQHQKWSEQRRRDNKWLQQQYQTCQKASNRVKSWMLQVLFWQRSKRRSLLAAAALCLAIFLGSQQSLTQQGSPCFYNGYRPEINVIAKTAAQQYPFTSANAMQDKIIPEASWVRQQQRLRGGQQLQRGAKKHGNTLGHAELVVEDAVAKASFTTTRTLRDALVGLSEYMQGPKSDTLLLLLATALITPLCKRLGTSPILGFLTAGMLLGPNGFGLISGIHTTETLAELGIVFFLFEMGIELSFERLLSMRKDVFGLGLSQFLATALAVAGVGSLFGLPGNALVVLGGGLALSSSAFVLQLLKDKQQLATRFGKAAFGVLLFQDLAVVPLLVVTPILAGGGRGLASALASALIKAGMALGAITFLGRVVLNPLFKIVAEAQSQEAFLGVILLTVLSMSFMTEGLGLSNTLGAFLAGVLLSETKYRYQVEADIAPFRGILLGLFFVTVGFEIDLHLIARNLPLVGSLVMGILLLKAVITTALSLAFGLSLSTSQQTGLILSQGGEFAFVAFGLARSLKILDQPTTKLMLTCVSLTMAFTPFLATLGSRIAKTLEEKSDFTHYLGQDRDASEIKESDEFVVVVGYGVVGKIVCDLLDRKLIKYVGIEINPNKAIQARNKGLPVFFGDVGRQEVADAFNVGKSKAVIICIADRAQTNRAVISLRRWYPELKIFCRATDMEHANRLQKTLDVAAMVPILPEDNFLLTLPFGGAVLKALGSRSEEVDAILEVKRKEILSGRGLRENEEKLALHQLGVSVPNKPSATGMTAKAPVVDAELDELTAMKVAAAERVEAIEPRSSFVAQVIEEVCPGSAADGDDDTQPVVNGNVEIVVDEAEMQDLPSSSP